MENVHGYVLIDKWENHTSSKLARATKGGRTYLLKKYQTPVKPMRNGALDSKTFEQNKAKFEQFYRQRQAVNNAIRSVTGVRGGSVGGGNIVVPCEEFIEGNQYVEAIEYVEGAVSDKDLERVLATLPLDVKELLMKTAAGALSSLHAKGIVHSDLKLQNVLLVNNKSGHYVARLIDFDNSYFVDQKPDEVVGDVCYYSPEFGVYVDVEDEEERKELDKILTQKSDIFSLGLIFHFYLSGTLPEPTDLNERLLQKKSRGKKIYCWVALNQGGKLELSPAIKSAKYVSLINAMLNPNPDKRPTAIEVLKRLNDDEPNIENPWPEHSVKLLQKKLEDDEAIGVKRTVVSGEKRYEVLFRSGEEKVLRIDEMKAKGYAIVVTPGVFCEPWPEHHIEFDVAKINATGYVAGTQREWNGKRGYEFYRANDESRFFGVETLKVLGLIKSSTETPIITVSTTTASPPIAPAAAESKTAGVKTPEPSSVESKTLPPAPGETKASPSEFDDVLWPEHKISIDADAAKAMGYVKTRRETMNGVRGYLLTDAKGNERFLTASMLTLLKIAKKM